MCPQTRLLRVCWRGLRDAGKYQRVLESSSSATGDYLLRGKLYEFGEVDGVSVQTKISL